MGVKIAMVERDHMQKNVFAFAFYCHFVTLHNFSFGLPHEIENDISSGPAP